MLGSCFFIYALIYNSTKITHGYEKWENQDPKNNFFENFWYLKF